MPAFAEQIATAQTRWDAAAALLRRWNSRPDNVVPVRDDDAFLARVDEVREHFDADPDRLDLTERDRDLILSATSDGDDLHQVDAVGFGVSFAASAGFAECWRDRIGSATYRPAVGDVFPAANPPWPATAGQSRRTPSVGSMGIHVNDHPHARAYRGGAHTVEFDFGLWRPLLAIGERLDLVAAATVNETLDELGLGNPPEVAFPVTPVDADRQADAVLGLLKDGVTQGACVMVFPELSGSPEITERIARELSDDDRQRLVVCGSWHETTESGEPANVSVGLISGVPGRIYHAKLTEFGDLYPKDPEKRVREGIRTPDPPLLRIYVAGPFRYSLTICKDYLDRDVADTLDHVGGNVLLVPAMSRTTNPFQGRAAAHITDAQAVSVVANGPRVWGAAPVVPTAFLARPYEPAHLLEVVAGESPSLAVFSLRGGVAR